MRWLRALALRLGAPFTGGRHDREFRAELQSHLQMHIDDNLRAGMTPDEARRHAVLRLGGVAQTEEHQRDRRGFRWLDSLGRDLRYAGRTLLHSPGFSLAAIVVLALGIGANTAIFSIVHAVLLRPLPFPNADRLTRIWHTPPHHLFEGQSTFSVSPANYFDWRERNRAFERTAIYAGQRLNMSGTGEPQAVRGARVSADFWNVLGVTPMIGRGFEANEDQQGRNRVAMISESLWRSQFGGRSDILDATIRLDGQPYSVIGIVAARDAFPFTAQIWVPLAFSAEERAVRGIHDYAVLGRLKPGVSVAQAQADMSRISIDLENEYPVDNKGWGAVVIPLHEDLVSDIRLSLLVLFGAVALVLLIACANLANLLLAKTLARARDVAIRTALGASRRRLMQQVLCETTLLAVAGGVAGVFVARAALAAMVGFVGSQLPRGGDVAVSLPVMAFAFALSIVTGIAAGLLPAWRITGGDIHETLKQSAGRGTSRAGEQRTRGALVVSEVALALVLLIGAGLLIRTLAALQRVDPGFDPTNVQAITLWLPPAKYPDDPRRVQFVDAALERIRAIPGVESAAAIDSLPLTGGSTQPVAIDGRPAVQMSEQPEVAVRTITPGYLRSLRLRLLAGRDVAESDADGRPPVVLISDAMARRFWPNENPIGKRLTLTFFPGVVREIVGVVADVKMQGLDVREPVAAVYVPYRQTPRPFMSMVARTTVPPSRVAGAMTAAIRQIDSEQPFLSTRTLEDLVAESVAQQRFNMALLAAFAGIALLLAGVGIYSVLAYTVRQRVREIGIRMALGAPAADVVRSVVIEGLRPTLIGIALGLTAAAALGRVLATLIYGVSPYDVLTFATVAAGVIAVGVLASLLPAYRATRVDPLVALRAE